MPERIPEIEAWRRRSDAHDHYLSIPIECYDDLHVTVAALLATERKRLRDPARKQLAELAAAVDALWETLRP